MLLLKVYLNLQLMTEAMVQILKNIKIILNTDIAICQMYW